MSTTETQYKHIVVDESGVPYVSGTMMKVVEIVMAQLAYGWSPDELVRNFPDLTLGSAHSALAYYWDHRDAMDADIRRRMQGVENIRARLPESLLVQRLRQQLGRG